MTNHLLDKSTDITAKKMPLMGHLDELRRRLIVVIASVLVAFCVSFYYSERLLWLVQLPVRDYELIFIAPTEAFFVNLKVAFFSGLL